MKVEKFVLALVSSALSLMVTFTATGAEKLQTMDAIWSSVGVTQGKAYKRTNRNVNPVTKQRNFTKKLTRAQYQARFAKKEEQKLARQRAAWRAKWLAEQKVKQQTQALAQKKSPEIVSNTQAKKVQPHKKEARPIVQQKVVQPPIKLTRAQYQWRWKQAQLKKESQKKSQQNVRNTGHKNDPQKLTQASFKPNNQAPLMSRLPQEIVANLRARGVREYGMSAFVQDVNSPKPLLAYQDKTSRVPASVMKLITSYAALGTLGPNYRWPLDILTTGTIRNGTLQGDLIVKGYGSPEFNTAGLRKVLKGIRQKGIQNVNGRIVFDNSYFNLLSKSAGAFDGKAQSAYNAMPDALLFNERLNVFNLRASGKRVKVTSLTPTHNLKIVNRMKRYKRSCKARMRVSHRGQKTIVTFTGGLARRCGTRSFARVISKPENMIYGSMRSLWKREVGGKLNTQFAVGRAPANARLLFRSYSRTLAEILPTIAKDSNNVMARQLLLTIGAKKSGRQGTEKNGANAVSAWLASRGLRFPELRIENGSGLSRYARISARHVGNLLVDAYRSPYRNILMQSLAIAGVDGTMKRRLRGTKVRGRGYFKTGTLRDVRSIAGYVKAANGKTYVMAILHNDPKARSRALQAHDKLIQWVFDGGRSRQQLAMR